MIVSWGNETFIESFPSFVPFARGVLAFRGRKSLRIKWSEE
jgi:hypothetical protein